MALCWADTGMLCDLDPETGNRERLRSQPHRQPCVLLNTPQAHTWLGHHQPAITSEANSSRRLHTCGERRRPTEHLSNPIAPPENIWPQSFHGLEKLGGGKSEYSHPVNTDSLRDLIVCSKHHQQRCILSQLFGFCRIRFPPRNYDCK